MAVKLRSVMKMVASVMAMCEFMSMVRFEDSGVTVDGAERIAIAGSQS